MTYIDQADPAGLHHRDGRGEIEHRGWLVEVNGTLTGAQHEALHIYAFGSVQQRHKAWSARHVYAVMPERRDEFVQMVWFLRDQGLPHIVEEHTAWLPG